MAELKLKAPVGLSPRTSEGAPVKNQSADVILVRAMLESNKIGPLGVSGKMDAGLLKAIGRFQKKIGIKNPDQVIDPGERTFKALVPAHKKVLKDLAKEPLLEVKYRGKVIRCTKKEYDDVVKDIFKQLSGYTKSLLSNQKFTLKTYQEYLDTAMLKDGVLNAVAQVIIIKAGSVKMPDNRLATQSISAAGKLERAIISKDLKLLNTALPEAEKAINAFNNDLMRFLKEFTGSAQTTVTVLGVSSAACFAVVGVLATPVLIGAGMSATGAAITGGAGVSILQTASQEIGKHASGQKVTVWDSVKSVAIDGTIGAMTAGIGKKLPLGWIDKLAKGIAPRLASKVPFMATKQLEKYISNYIAGSGQAVVTSALSEAVKTIGTMMKSGKAPTEKDFDKIIQNIVYAALLGGMVKNLGSFQKKWAYKNKELLTGKLVPSRWDKIVKNNDIPNTLKAKLWAEVANKVSDTAIKAGYDEVLKTTNGDEATTKMLDAASKALQRDKKLEKLIDAEIQKALKKNKLEPA